MLSLDDYSMTPERQQELDATYRMLTKRHLDNIFKISKNFDNRRLSEEDYDRMELHYERTYLISLVTVFNKLTWEEQIYFCLAANNKKLTNRLDEDQLVTMKIVA